MVPLGQALEQLINKLGLAHRVKQQSALVYWEETVGREIGRNTKPAALRRGVLFVWVRDSAWAAQLAFLKGELIERLNARVGERVVQDIHWLVKAWEVPNRSLVRGPGVLFKRSNGLAVKKPAVRRKGQKDTDGPLYPSSKG